MESDTSWSPPDIDNNPPSIVATSCATSEVLDRAFLRTEGQLANFEKFTATEHIEHQEIDRHGTPIKVNIREFSYIVFVVPYHGDSFYLEESRDADQKTTDSFNAWSSVFFRVALPVVRPGLWVTALFSLLLAYNEFLFALVLTGPDTKTLPVAIAEYGGEDINYWSLSAAAAVGIMLPMRGVHDGAAAPPGARPGTRRNQGLRQFRKALALRDATIACRATRPHRGRNRLADRLRILLKLRR